ncbi:MAG: DUF3883 domain-containing protein [Chloroflexi bacterium]|nr:DUF3883 domain-containing protein [Chloroflexota bacterium]
MPRRDEESSAAVLIAKGDTIQSAIWPEPVEVALVEEIDGGAYVRIVGELRQSRGHVDQFLSRAEAAQLQPTRDGGLFTAAPRDVFLAMETRRYRFAALYDPLLAMNTSEVDPLPHQIEAVYGYVLKLPRIRFLIADDPGAGKTIMAGLLIKELKLRHLVKRILIVAPGHLKDQWRRELKERFEENFTVVDRGVMDALYGENIWARELQIITSLDFAKQEDILASLAAVHFDLVVVDEAHKMAAYRYGAKLDKTSRYRLGEALSEHSTHLLFLTATPHRGDPESFRLSLDLLEPGFFATPEMVEESIRNQDNPLFIRRVKEDLRDFEGRPLFLPRHVETRAYALGVESPAEKTLYNDLSRYVNEQYNRALQRDRRRNVAFALVILQRRLASSTYALLRSLERRQARLRDLLAGKPAPRQQANTFEIDAAEELSEEERWRQEELWETLSVAENRQELEREIATLDALIAQAKTIIGNDGEIKLRHLRRALEGLDRSDPGVRVLIFTESHDTLDYLERRLHAWGYRLCTIHGGMRLEERIAAEGSFRRGEAQLMVATEAAGEGINLQVCHLMVNYDLPWNPNRLEQRMGRIHRYGQTKEVYIFNLVASDTREGQVLTRLFAKLEEIKAALGNDKVFDVIGEVLEGRDLADLLLQAAASARGIDEILRELDVRVDQGYVARVRENLGESLATRYIDYTRIRELADQAREHRLIPEYTEAFFKRAVDAAGGRWHERRAAPAVRTKVNGDGTHDERDGEADAVPAGTGTVIPPSCFLTVESLPFAVRQIGDDSAFQRQHGLLARRYPFITFDKEIAFRTPEAEFVSFGHPLFEALLRWVERTLDPALGQGAAFTDPDGRLDGVLLFYESEVRDGLGAIAGSRLFALMYDLTSAEMRPADAAILWDLQEGGDVSGDPSFGLDELKRRAWGALLPELESYRGELSQERRRQGTIKEKYGVKSLEYLVVKLDGDLIALYARQAEGESVDLPIRNKEEQKRGYERALIDLQESVAREQTLTLATPRFVAAVRVVPAVVVADGLASDPEVERIGMEVTTRHERGQGRTPEDVSKQNLGFDIRSTDAEGQKRYIEVKARAGVGSVLLTQNEWFKAQRFRQDYYLYVVLNAASTPELHIIRDPAAILRPEEQVEVRYLVTVGDILAQKETT